MPRLIDELVPGLTAMVDDVDVGGEDALKQPVVAHEVRWSRHPGQFGS